MTIPIIAFSERLAPLTHHEEPLWNEIAAQVQVVPLWTIHDIISHAASAVALMVGAVEPLTREAMEALTRCRVIVRRGVGVDNVDLEAATDLGIAVAYVPDASVQEVSDHALALLLALERKLISLDALVKTGRWTHSTLEMATARKGMRRLAELTLGVVGFGRIGREFARKAAPLFHRTLVFDPFVAEAPGVDVVDFDTVLRVSDVVSLHAPLTDSTNHLFDKMAFAAMKPGCTIVNTSRGALIDTDALVGALRSGAVRAAGLDVTEVEPVIRSSELLSFDNVILTGHTASYSESSAADMRIRAVAAVLDALSGRRPAFVANEAVLDRRSCRL
jgi:D-3-phosphoglycerate dehydrogenase